MAGSELAAAANTTRSRCMRKMRTGIFGKSKRGGQGDGEVEDNTVGTKNLPTDLQVGCVVSQHAQSRRG